DVLADVGRKHRAVLGVPRETLRVADTVGVDLRQCPLSRYKGIRGGNPVPATASRRAERVDAENLAERGTKILGESLRIAAATAVSDAHVQQPEVWASGTHRGVERDHTAVVIGVRLTQ